MIFGREAETHKEIEIDRQYSRGKKARSENKPPITSYGLSQIHLKYAWLAGWHDKDMELGVSVLEGVA